MQKNRQAVRRPGNTPQVLVEAVSSWNAQPTEARMTSTGVSSLLLTVTCMVTPSASASLDLTSTSQPPL